MISPHENLNVFLERLKEDTSPKWGTMTAQHMLEHTSLSFKISNGRLPVKSPVPWDNFSDEVKTARKAYLMSNEPYAENLQRPGSDGTLPKLRKKNLDEAKAYFLDEWQAYLDFWKEKPDAVLLHPAFGPLNRSEWDHFHSKHLHHHFRQFGLLPEQQSAD